MSDGEGKPIAGIRVKSYVYWSQTDQGVLIGADFLGDGTSDENGRIQVIDGDYTYAFQVSRKADSGNPAGMALVVKRLEDTEYPVTLPDDSAMVSK